VSINMHWALTGSVRSLESKNVLYIFIRSLIYAHAGSSSNGSHTSANKIVSSEINRTNDVTPSGGGQQVTSSTAGSTIQGDRQLRVAAQGGWDMASVSVSASAPPSCGSGGSMDDEWSRQLDELDRLRPSTAEPMACGSGMGTGRSVIDFFSDLPDVVLDDEPVMLNQMPKSNGVSIAVAVITNIIIVVKERFPRH